MEELYQKAIDKLDREAEDGKEDNPAYRAIETILREVCKGSPEACERVLTEDKTIAGAYDDMERVARKRAKNGCACVGPDEAQRIIFDYYGISADIANPQTHEIKQAPAAKLEPQTYSLFDLI